MLNSSSNWYSQSSNFLHLHLFGLYLSTRKWKGENRASFPSNSGVSLSPHFQETKTQRLGIRPATTLFLTNEPLFNFLVGQAAKNDEICYPFFDAGIPLPHVFSIKHSRVSILIYSFESSEFYSARSKELILEVGFEKCVLECRLCSCNAIESKAGEVENLECADFLLVFRQNSWWAHLRLSAETFSVCQFKHN